MGKVKKTHLKNKKAKAKAQGKKTEADGDEVLDAGETSHELKRRHAAERKALQAKIVELKRQRKKLPKKKNKDDKKALTEEMKKLKSHLVATAGIFWCSGSGVRYGAWVGVRSAL
ncbi:unnamed protein product [Durusdinium trenchii]|uniref:Uncharacterized protein n=1 Tax=Durusdinium trenchii TaxID=1381693 RepID=A0ABP0KI19_9DINO